MNRIKYFTLFAIVLGSVTAFAAKDSAVHIQNSVRVGYDDNVYQRDDNQQESAFITDIVNISGELTFSDRSDLELYWAPEFRYRFDVDPKTVTYQEVYAQLNHAVSQRTFLQLSDQLRYQEKDGEGDVPGDEQNQNYLENDLSGSLSSTLNSKSQLRVGGGHAFRTWDDNDYGATNDYDRVTANGVYVRELRPDTTDGMVGVNYMNHSYDFSDRGEFESTTVYGGVEHTFSPNLSGNAQVGVSLFSVDGADGSEDASSPFAEAGLAYNLTDRTSISGSLGYSISSSQNSFYNAKEGIDLGLGIRHDLTGKISVSGALSYVLSDYDAKYSILGQDDAEEDFIRLSLRGSYQINRNNFVDIGYAMTDRSSDSDFLNEYTRNRVDFGWRVHF